MRHQHGHGHGDGRMGGNPAHYDRMTRLVSRGLRRRVAADVAGLGLPADALVLDVGTGPGRLPVAIARHNPQLRVVGLDVDPGMIEVARTIVPPGGRVSAEVADVAHVPYEDGSVDLVLSTLSLHHWPDRAAGIRELARVLAPGGRLWIYDVRRALPEAEQAATDAFGAAAQVEKVRGAGLIGHFMVRLTVTRTPTLETR